VGGLKLLSAGTAAVFFAVAMATMFWPKPPIKSFKTEGVIVGNREVTKVPFFHPVVSFKDEEGKERRIVPRAAKYRRKAPWPEGLKAQVLAYNRSKADKVLSIERPAQARDEEEQ
jgi:hypothetical protein